MKRPFPFSECLLTDQILDVIGFTEYWSGCGDFGTRNLDLGGAGYQYQVSEFDSKDDEDDGYGYGPPCRVPNHFGDKDFVHMYFLHEMFDDIMERRTSEEVEFFISILKKKGVNLYPYIDSYLKLKSEIKDKTL